jgi:hypothetical protein
MLAIPAFTRLRQEELNFEVSLGYIAQPCPKEEKKITTGSRKRQDEDSRVMMRVENLDKNGNFFLEQLLHLIPKDR